MLRFSILTILVSLLPETVPAQTPKGPERWETNIAEFEKKIAAGESKPGSILFIGSSSIRLWNLPKSFPEQQTVNHGFGGSEVSDSLHFYDRIVRPLKPSMILMYAGDNDIAKGKTAEIVHRDFASFVRKVRQDLGTDTKVGYIAIKPSLSRWNLSAEMHKANQLIAKDCEDDDQLVYVDIWKPMLGEDGKPKPQLFAKDGLHLNEVGYDLWTGIVKKHLRASN